VTSDEQQLLESVNLIVSGNVVPLPSPSHYCDRAMLVVVVSARGRFGGQNSRRMPRHIRHPSLSGHSNPADYLNGEVKLIVFAGRERFRRPGDFEIRLDTGSFKPLALPCDVFSLRHDKHITLADLET